jgi:hypothetical protein
MSKQACVMSAEVAVLALGSLVFLAEHGNAGDNQALKDSVLKIANTYKKGDKAGAEKQAAALAKKLDGLDELMDLFKKRDKGGYGVGSKPGVVQVGDGIEIKLMTMGRDAPTGATLKKEGDAIEEMGYVIAAMAAVAKNKPVAKAKTKEWNGWCDDMVAGGLKLSEAAKIRGAADLKTASSKLNVSCNSCHSTYRK